MACLILTYSNTTLVKVKLPWQNYVSMIIMWNSNTTLVKVKCIIARLRGLIPRNSNTTLVKVKFCYFAVAVYVSLIQIQHLLKLNGQPAKKTNVFDRFKYNTC